MSGFSQKKKTLELRWPIILGDVGAEFAERVVFGDYQPNTGGEITEIIEKAKSLDIAPVTTEKDHGPLDQTAAETIETVQVDIDWDDAVAFTGWLDKRIQGAARGD